MIAHSQPLDSSSINELTQNNFYFDYLHNCNVASLQIDEPFELTFGDRFESVRVDYAVYGDIKNPAIVILGGISANKYVADTIIDDKPVKGWWNDLIGFGKAIDMSRFCVISFEYFDGRKNDSSTTDWEHLEETSPKISTFDQASILNRLREELNLEKIHCLIGSSYGGMVGLAFAQKFPDKLEQLIAIGSTEKSSAKNTALRSLQREILKFAIKNNEERKGLELARILAILGYRGVDELESRFNNRICEKQQMIEFPIMSYLNYQGGKFADFFSAERFHNLSLSIDLHKIEPQKISVKCLCVGIQEDLIAPIEQVKELVTRIGANAQYTELKSQYGHDGFLKEFDQLERILATRLEYN
ncbi:MAG: alpha/beta fold hydrolase [Gammaproteobacteria bacterium]|nr:alpha/beta fold hydrolase [Gammaproteobacteria bacterium]